MENFDIREWKQRQLLTEDIADIARVVHVIVSAGFLAFVAGLVAYMAGSGEHWFARVIDKSGEKAAEIYNRVSEKVYHYLSKLQTSDSALEQFKNELKRKYPDVYNDIISGNVNASQVTKLKKVVGDKSWNMLNHIVDRMSEKNQ